VTVISMWGRNKKKRRGRTRGRSFSAYVLTALAFIVVLFWFRLPIARTLVRCCEAQVESLVPEVPVIGFSLYRERVLVAPIDGAIEYTAEEGSLVPQGEVLARIADPQGRETYAARRELLLLEMAEWQRVNAPAMELTLSSWAENRAALTGEAWRWLVQPVGEAEIAGLAAASSAYASSRALLIDLWAEWARMLERLEDLTRLADRSSAEVCAPVPGIVLLRVDGLENPLRWESLLSDCPLDQLLSWSEGPDSGTPPVQAKAGQPVAKVIDHLVLDAVVIGAAGDMCLVSEGQQVRIELDGIPQQVEAVVAAVGPSTPLGRPARLQVKHCLPHFYQHRRWAGVLHPPAMDGQLVPRSALAARGAQAGMYSWEQGRPRYFPVEVVGVYQDQVVVKGLPVGASVICNPWVIRFFQLDPSA